MIIQPQQSQQKVRRGLVRVVDDEAPIHTLFQQICQREGLACECYSCGKPFLTALDPEVPGCLVLDLNLPDCSGLDVLSKLAELDVHLPVVCMSGLADVRDAVRALKLGSIDFVEKPFALADMVAAIHRAIDADQRNREQDAARRELLARFAAMTPREREVMDLVVAGLPNKLIATRLGVSPKTIEVHRAHVMQKSRANSLADLVRMNIAAGRGTATPAAVG